MTGLSTHVLDAVRGVPAAGVAVWLTRGDQRLTEALTDADGRVKELAAGLNPGDYRLFFDTGSYFAAQGVETFYPEVCVAFTVAGQSHLHVPLLLSPFAYSTYRGS
ncbi:hydroxyisourate hydrolase [Nocardia asteroides]|uniref:5-hydroxyisourate hydrolase n=1 Tax=Nocardia asteroides NBRC 15531 TaxID=1110697 RepID=U5EEJ8_NOCAS|nr:hydroxyisourate hydrolase [Nocardia asteroides]TLF69561.1 hydroxyisourate hydrolase [Nocardia asteroides NBRC 15531]UGT49065.1 hydroxyisourate hydrolase [Nocardia asteroides]SFL79086.1 5-hydroxyisourate hydrolase [Nocardia asteroides]VEG31159.1 5-hydroxyisourate hydrolase precursor [Nocardia asteroides]GAD83619.1 putative 5-hydroxyisourate hydrolase [Nocardia asteroides NBRC 15531]